MTAGLPAGIPTPEVKTENLGTQTIEGITVEGTRRTMTAPAGMAVNGPRMTKSESWYSPELKATLLSKEGDAETGERTKKLIHVSRSQPSPGLFAPPKDFTVVDEQGDFYISLR
jgi:hypothetical protein